MCYSSLRILSVILAMYLFVGQSLAQTPANQPIAGIGASSCGKYLGFRTEQTTDFMMKSWVQGFLSGMNWSKYVAEQRMSILPDAESLTAYLDKYCRENPLKDPWMGTIEMFNELKILPK